MKFKLFDYRKVKSKSEKPGGNIFFIGPYTGKLYYFSFLARKLSRNFNVILIQPKDECLSYNTPENLEIAINQVGEFIKMNQSGSINNFIIGVSIGSYFAFNSIPYLDLVNKYFFVAGGMFITRAIENKAFKSVMNAARYEDEIIKSATKKWHSYETKHMKNIKLEGKKIKLIISRNDKLVLDEYVQEIKDHIDFNSGSIIIERTSLPGHQTQAMFANMYYKQIEGFFSC
ncbi:MAG: hypothetical protein WAS94_02720 [Candidatus Saccharimonadales bacterium]